MSAITFATLKFANRLKSAGVPDQQAESRHPLSGLKQTLPAD